MSNQTNGSVPQASSDRFEAPMYLARFRDRHAVPADRNRNAQDDGVPLYLKRFREQPMGTVSTRSDVPLWQRTDLGMQQALTEDNRNKEISPPASMARQLLNDVYLIRHGETQGYSTDSGLTPQGAWQAHSYGRTLARRVKSGETVVFRHAATNRARETAEQIHRGLLDGCISTRRI